MAEKRKSLPESQEESWKRQKTEAMTPMTVTAKSGLGRIFEEGFRDSDIRCLIIPRLSSKDLLRLGAVSRTTRSFLCHRQTTEQALRAGIRTEDVASPLFHRLQSRLNGQEKLALADKSQPSKLFDWKEALNAALAAEYGGHWTVFHRSRSGHVLAASGERTAWVVLDKSDGVRQFWPCRLRGYFAAVSEGGKHWLAVTEYFWPWESFQLHVFCNGSQLHTFYPMMPVPIFGPADYVQLCPAWGRLYLAVIKRKREQKKTKEHNRIPFLSFTIRIYSLGTQNEMKYTWPKLIYTADIHFDIFSDFCRDLFFFRVKGDQLWLSRVSQSEELEVQSLVVERGGETVTELSQPIHLPPELRPKPSNLRLATAVKVLGIGGRLLAIMPASGEAGRRRLVALLAYEEGAWTHRHSLQLRLLAGQDAHIPGRGCINLEFVGDDFRWLKPEMLEEGLRVEDFTSGEPWLELCQTESLGFKQHRTLLFPPSLD